MDDQLLSLLAAVCADPAADSPRLIMADRLDELGECDRAEFIRVQCEMDRLDALWRVNALPRDFPSERRGILRTRGRELYRVLGQSLVSSLPLAVGPRFDSVFCRGFVKSVSLTAADFLEHADELLWHPSQDRLCPPTAQPVEKVILTTPWPGHIRMVFDKFPKDKPVPATVYLTEGYDSPGRPVMVTKKWYGKKPRHTRTHAEMLQLVWPWVEFVMPTHSPRRQAFDRRTRRA